MDDAPCLAVEAVIPAVHPILDHVPEPPPVAVRMHAKLLAKPGHHARNAIPMAVDELSMQPALGAPHYRPMVHAV